jgi:hypothetical protein
VGLFLYLLFRNHWTRKYTLIVEFSMNRYWFLLYQIEGIHKLYQQQSCTLVSTWKFTINCWAFELNIRKNDLDLLKNAMEIYNRVTLLWAMHTDDYGALLLTCVSGFFINSCQLLMLVHETKTINKFEHICRLVWMLLEMMNWSCIFCYVFNQYKNCTFAY